MGLFDTKSMRLIACAPLSAVILSAAYPSSAQDAVVVGVDASSAALNLTLAGHIDERCSMSGGEAMSLGEITPGEGAGARFDLSCNVPFDLHIVSQNGGLAHETQPQGEGQFAGLLLYDLRIRTPTRSPDPDVLEGTFSSRELQSSAVLSSGDAVSGEGGGRLYLVTRGVSGPGLLAGRYSEMITLSVEPRI
ncbi:MAG: hypothetical protein EON90_03475 [Brevundimonas sp.]|nr:MAG: hypothetical protein EON90_03475 [Brevundimonas sp.]